MEISWRSSNERQLCVNCGTKIKKAAKFCPKCGCKQNKDKKSWKAVAICTILLILICVLLVVGLKDNGFIAQIFQPVKDKNIDTLEFYGGYVGDMETAETDDEGVSLQEEILPETDMIKETSAIVEGNFLEDIGFTYDDVEPEVENIRELYYRTQEEQDRLTQENVDGITYYTYNEQIVKIEIKSGYANSPYSRLYYYFDDQLYFAFVFNGTEEHRFYYKNEELIRYIDASKTVYDYGTDGFKNIVGIDDVILEEAKAVFAE